jgi:hypothetical protein
MNTLSYSPNQTQEQPRIIDLTNADVPTTPSSSDVTLDLGKYEQSLAERDEVARNLLGTDYQYAKDQGLIDMFYVDPITGSDGFKHVFLGDVYHTENGEKIVSGFHHAESSTDPSTYLRHELAATEAKNPNKYIKRPFEPYQGYGPVIHGVEKISTELEIITNALKVIKGTSNMFPSEYDCLAVLIAIKHATDDPEAKITEARNPNFFRQEGGALMVDNKTKMRIQIVRQKDTGKIVSAFPVARGRLLHQDTQTLLNAFDIS